MVGIEQGTLDFIRRSRIDRINVVDTSAIVAIKRNKYEKKDRGSGLHI